MLECFRFFYRWVHVEEKKKRIEKKVLHKKFPSIPTMASDDERFVFNGEGVLDIEKK